MPPTADVVVVGAGYTGLAAARTLARNGVATVVLEAERVGWGGSGRNAGFVLPGLQPGFRELVRRGGAGWAVAWFDRSMEAVRCLETVMDEERLACDYGRCGWVALAERPSEMRALEEEHRLLAELAGHPTELLDRAAVAAEVGSRRYLGGLLDPRAGALHPARYCAGLAGAAARAGARLVERAAVRRVVRRRGGFEIETSRGVVRARDMLVATDGYTGAPFHRLRRRVIPVGSHIVATAPLDPELARRLVPGGRVLSDSRHLLHYFRLSPDGRMLFGGRRAPRYLRRAMLKVFPELESVPVEFAWSGSVGFTLDRLPHAGRMDGVHYALGYCGHGVALSTWLGCRMGEALAGVAGIPDLGPLRPIPLYTGRPWFLPLAGAYYRLRDWV